MRYEQVALIWSICKGAVESAEVLGWRLSADEVAALDQGRDEARA